MKPHIFAILFCLLLAFSIFQGVEWHWRPEVGWHPSWWQFQSWASLGFVLTLPAGIPVLFALHMGAKSDTVLWVALAIGFICEFAATYAVVYWVAKSILTNSRKAKSRDVSAA